LTAKTCCVIENNISLYVCVASQKSDARHSVFCHWTTGGGFVRGRDVIDSSAFLIFFFLLLHQVFIEFSKYIENIVVVGFEVVTAVVSCSAYSTLKIEAICSSETSVDLQPTTLPYTILVVDVSVVGSHE
jgi:hypothetical protein